MHVYTDGSVHLNHGGTEMGQGLYVKVAQVVAEEFQIDLDQVKITATTTAKVPNTSATAASSGSDLNGMAARNAARIIRGRLADFAAERYGVPHDQVVFLPNRVRVGNQEIPFGDLVKQAYMARIQLSAAGFYKTPKIHWDRDKGEGHPFYYFAYGASCSEVSIDTLTGEYMVERTDILHETGRSLNPAIDLGQIEGGFIQGMGWLTTEELWWDEKGRLQDARALDLQDPARLRPAEDLQRRACRLVGEPRADHPPLQGGRRAALHARHVGAARAVGRGGERGGASHLPAPRRAGDARAGADGDRAAEDRSRPIMSDTAPALRRFLAAARGGGAGRGGGGEGLDAARARRLHAGLGRSQLRHHRRRPAGVHGHRPSPPAARRRRCRPRLRSTCRWVRKSGNAAAGGSACSIRRLDETLAGDLLSEVESADAARPHVYLFGGGHVGQALASALSLLPVTTTVVETRPRRSRACRRRWRPG